jgi:trans-2,3-dihydro-3-hydroxyanthranilate isomerase
MRKFLQYDVFTATPMTGNQLAVFLDGSGLSTGQMQTIAREMNFSESTFVLPPEAPDTVARVRIFTPGVEMQMAGHPTIGTTFALAQTGVIPPGTPRVVLGLNIGPTPVDLEWSDAALRFAWMTQRAPEFGEIVFDRPGVIAMLGLERRDLHPTLPVQKVSCGVPYLIVPLRDRATVDKAVTDIAAVRRFAGDVPPEEGIFLFALGAEGEETVYSRMLAPQLGVAEDPATGSAAGPLGCYLVRHGVLTGDAARSIVNAQGVAMQRPSRIHIAIEGSPAAITSVKVGGEARLVARGELLVE